MSGDERAGTRRTRRARTAARSDASSPGNKSGKSGAPRGTSRGKKGSDAAPPLPDRDAILEFIRTSETKVGKREIARAFGIRGADKIALKALIRELADEGLIAGNRRHMRGTGTLPPVTVLEIVAQDDDGEYVCRPARGDDGEGVTPQGVIVDGPRRGESPAGIGDRVLARLTPISEPDPGGYAFTAEIIKKLPRDDRQLLGVFRTASDDRSRDAGFIEPIDRRNLKTFLVAKADQDEARDGDLVRFTLTGNRRLGPPRARVATVLGNPDDQRQISLIAVHAHGIPETFSPAVIAALDELPPLDLSARDDLRDIPLLTIDPADARDHDDAVHARSDDDAANPGGWVVTVAIADVAHYVRPDTALDRAALERANSVYFPDRVVPMLPEKISNDLCSLRADVERPCLAMRMVFDATGKRRSFRVLRGVMRSRARLSYQQAQSAIDGEPDADTAPLLDDILRPLWSAYRTLAGARDTRAPLDLDLPERRITIGEDGRVAGISVPPRLEAHRLIEEFMIQANVAAAEALEA
ncbi:MAG: RNB domain-containing ribonuclease, partial [Pseudomonadota bacterium]